MMTIDIQAVEKRAWRSFFSDGRLELSFGLAFILLGALQFIPEGPFEWIYIPLLVLVPGLVGIGCKRYITQPRIGRVTFSRKRRLNMAGAVLFLAASVLFGAAAWMTAASLSPDVNSWLSSHWVMVLLVAKVVLVFGVIAYFFDYLGVFFIGLALAACFLADNYWQTPILFFIVGAGITCVGIVKLVVFIRSNPVATEEE
jgi:hypothetical protein